MRGGKKTCFVTQGTYLDSKTWCHDIEIFLQGQLQILIYLICLEDKRETS